MPEDQSPGILRQTFSPPPIFPITVIPGDPLAGLFFPALLRRTRLKAEREVLLERPAPGVRLPLSRPLG